MDPNLLKAALAGRKQVIDATSTTTAVGTGTGSSSRWNREQFAPRSESGRVGLINQGATCYLNSLLQTLYMMPEFRRALFKWRARFVAEGTGEGAPAAGDTPAAEPEQWACPRCTMLNDAAVPICGACGGANPTTPVHAVPTTDAEAEAEAEAEEAGCLPLQLQRLFAQLHVGERGATSTTALTKSFGWGFGEASVQHDAEECLYELLDAVDRSCPDSALQRHCNANQRGTTVQYLRYRLPPAAAAGGGDTEAAKQGQGKLVVREKEEAMLVANLECRGMASVEHALQKFVTADVLDGDNQYEATIYGADGVVETGTVRVDAEKGCGFGALPTYLKLKLQRFDMDWATMQRVKLDDSVSFPMRLDMGQYLHRRKDGAAPGPLYDLFSVLVHTGSAHAGHYIAYVRDIEAEADAKAKARAHGEPDPSTATDAAPDVATARWLRFNDSKVTPVAEDELEELFGNSSSATGKAVPPAPPATAVAEDASAAAAPPAAPKQQQAQAGAVRVFAGSLKCWYLLFFRRVDADAIVAPDAAGSDSDSEAGGNDSDGGGEEEDEEVALPTLTSASALSSNPYSKERYVPAGVDAPTAVMDEAKATVSVRKAQAKRREARLAREAVWDQQARAAGMRAPLRRWLRRDNRTYVRARAKHEAQRRVLEIRVYTWGARAGGEGVEAAKAALERATATKEGSGVAEGATSCNVLAAAASENPEAAEAAAAASAAMAARAGVVPEESAAGAGRGALMAMLGGRGRGGGGRSGRNIGGRGALMSMLAGRGCGLGSADSHTSSGPVAAYSAAAAKAAACMLRVDKGCTLKLLTEAAWQQQLGGSTADEASPPLSAVRLRFFDTFKGVAMEPLPWWEGRDGSRDEGKGGADVTLEQLDLQSHRPLILEVAPQMQADGSWLPFHDEATADATGAVETLAEGFSIKIVCFRRQSGAVDKTAIPVPDEVCHVSVPFRADKTPPLVGALRAAAAGVLMPSSGGNNGAAAARRYRLLVQNEQSGNVEVLWDDSIPLCKCKSGGAGGDVSDTAAHADLSQGDVVYVEEGQRTDDTVDTDATAMRAALIDAAETVAAVTAAGLPPPRTTVDAVAATGSALGRRLRDAASSACVTVRRDDDGDACAAAPVTVSLRAAADAAELRFAVAAAVGIPEPRLMLFRQSATVPRATATQAGSSHESGASLESEGVNVRTNRYQIKRPLASVTGAHAAAEPTAEPTAEGAAPVAAAAVAAVTATAALQADMGHGGLAALGVSDGDTLWATEGNPLREGELRCRLLLEGLSQPVRADAAPSAAGGSAAAATAVLPTVAALSLGDAVLVGSSSVVVAKRLIASMPAVVSAIHTAAQRAGVDTAAVGMRLRGRSSCGTRLTWALEDHLPLSAAAAVAAAAEIGAAAATADAAAAKRERAIAAVAEAAAFAAGDGALARTPTVLCDGGEIVVQLVLPSVDGVDASLVGPMTLMLHVQRWDPVRERLVPGTAREIGSLGTRSTVAELREVLQNGSGETGPLFAQGLRLVKPWTWQLRDETSLQAVDWYVQRCCYPCAFSPRLTCPHLPLPAAAATSTCCRTERGIKEDSLLGNAPWKLSSGAALLYAVRAVLHLTSAPTSLLSSDAVTPTLCVPGAQDVTELSVSAESRAAAQAEQGSAGNLAAAPRYQERGIKIMTIAEQKAARAGKRAEAEAEKEMAGTGAGAVEQA